MVGGWSNVWATYKEIGSNLLSGNIFTSVNVADEYKDTWLGDIASFITKPAFILGAPAAVAAVPIAATATGISLSSLATFAGSSTARNIALTGGVIAGSMAAIDTFKEGGVSGLITGTGTENPTARTVNLGLWLAAGALLIYGLKK